MEQWFLSNGIQVATLVTLVVLVFKISRWAGAMEARVKNIEGWQHEHIIRHPGKTKGI